MAAYIAFKNASLKTGWSYAGFFVLGLLIGIFNTYFFTKALKSINLSIAYPVFSALSICMIMLVSALIFHESIKMIHIIGAGVIIVGITLMSA